MASHIPEFEDEDDEFPDEDDMSVSLDCYSCFGEFTIGFGEEPDCCPLCGQDYE